MADPLYVTEVAPLPAGTNPLGSVAISDGVTPAIKGTVAQFHNADNQSLPNTAYGLLTGGVAQFVNPQGGVDRQRGTGTDGVPAVGISSSAANFAMSFKGTIAAAITANVAPQAVTPSAMSGTIGGVAWSIQVGSVLVIDSGANKEAVVVTAVTGTTFSAVFTKSHTTNCPLLGFVYNQERDAAGEADGASGIGTAVAAEYEFNGGAPGGANFDRARSVQAKGRTTAAISAGGAQASTSLTIAAAGTLKAGMQVLLYKASTFPAAGSSEIVYVDFSYIEGSTTVPLATPIVGTPVYDTIAYDSFAPFGPGLNGFNAVGVGIEEEALYDPVTGLFYLERAATQDAMPPQNVVAESPVLWNGTSFDRAPGDKTNGAFVNVKAMPPVSGTVSVSNFPATQPVSGTVTSQQGASSALNLTAATLVKASAGRLVRVHVLVAGTAAGSANDAATVAAAAATNQVFSIPNTVGSYLLDWPCAAGIVVTPGTGQTLAVSYA